MPRRRSSPIDYMVEGGWKDGSAVFDTENPVLDEALQRLCLTANLLRKRREDLGWSFETTGKRAGGMRRQTVAELEAGVSWPDAVTVHRLAIVLGLDSIIRDDPKARPGLEPADS